MQPELGHALAEFRKFTSYLKRVSNDIANFCIAAWIQHEELISLYIDLLKTNIQQKRVPACLVSLKVKLSTQKAVGGGYLGNF